MVKAAADPNYFKSVDDVIEGGENSNNSGGGYSGGKKKT